MIQKQFLNKSRKTRNSRRRQSRRKLSRQIRIQHGGVMVNLTQLLLTQPIIDAIQTQRAAFDARTENFKMSKEQSGFKLSRMPGMMSVANFDALLAAEPIEIRPAMKKSDGTILYEIQNGRHRVARAIAENRAQINATVV